MKSFFTKDFYRINAATLATILVLGSVVGALQYGNIVMQGYASPPSVATGNIDQCRNGGISFTGGVPTSVDAKKCRGFASSNLDTSTSTGWVNGNAGPSNAHWREGDFLSYRALITGMPTTSDVKVRISFDNVNGGKHALDYLGFGNGTETFSTSPTIININGVPTVFYKNDNDPCTGLASTDLTKLGSCVRTSPADTNLIGATPTGNANTDPLLATDPLLDSTHCTDPAHPNKSFDAPGTFNTGHTPKTGKMMIYGTGASIVGITYPSINILSGTDSCTSTIEVTIHTTNSNGEALLFWGGHIASENDWGAGNSASAISGSPYHMRLQSDPAAQSTFSVGNQDRSLKTSSVIFIPTIATVIKDSDGNAITDTNSDGIPDITVGSGGTTVHDTATLTDAFSSAGGQVTYVLYKDISTKPVVCDPAKKITRSGYPATVNVANGDVPDGPDITFVAADAGHIWAFAANYTGDSKDEPAKSACEPLDVRLPAVGTIVIIKNTDPRFIDQAFDFSCNFKDQFGTSLCNTYPGTSTFSLNDKDAASRTTQFDVTPGTYNATEINLPTGWSLKDLQCSDPTTDSTTDKSAKTAIIKVASEETVTCTFTDARAVVKITGFGYTNAPADPSTTDCTASTPTTGVLHGCATYKINLHNYGKNATTVNVLLTMGGAALTTIVSSTAGTVDNTAHTVTINGVTVNAESDATAITVVVRYDGTAGQTLNAALTVTYAGLSASGSPASVSFTLN